MDNSPVSNYLMIGKTCVDVRDAHCVSTSLTSSRGSNTSEECRSTDLDFQTCEFATHVRLYFPDEAPLQAETLATSLGPNPATYLSTTHGVELELQSESLIEKVRLPVTVSPRLQFVECRTEGSGR